MGRVSSGVVVVEKSFFESNGTRMIIVNEEYGTLTDETFVPSDNTGMVESAGGGGGGLIPSRGVGEPLMHDGLDDLVTYAAYGVHSS